jgi:hypothetical protein
MIIIHHYTNIDVLALILRNRTLRFNRLDQVDDPEESNIVSNGVNIGPYAYVGRNSVSSIGQNQSLTSLLN